jgi:hypothetical protein
MTKEFDFFFLPNEVGVVSNVVVPPAMIIVCRELADEATLTLFNFDQALSYRSWGGIYFRSDLNRIVRQCITLEGGDRIFLVNDLSLPAHLGIFAHRSIPPALPRAIICLVSRFSDGNDVVSPSVEIVEAFKSIRTGLKSMGTAFRAKGHEVLISDGARKAIQVGSWSTGDSELDKLIIALKGK